MSSPFGVATLVVDPTVESEIPAVRRALEAAGVEHRMAQAEAPADGRFVVAVGGDRIVHDVVNRLFQEHGPQEEPPVLGVIAAGTENEFIRQFGLPLDTDRACTHLSGENVYPIDVGVATCVGDDGGERSLHFVNVAEVGLGAEIATRAARRRGRAALFLAFWSAILRSKRATVHVEVARKVYDGTAYNVVIGNGRFGPGGFRVSPRSFPGDGILEVLVHHGPKSSAFTSLPRAYRGEQVPSPHISELRGNRVRVAADPSLPVAVDFRRMGRTPASFEVLPQALWLKV